MIATNEAVDVLRHGWQDAASTLAAEVPEVAELLEARLEMAIADDRLDETHLLDTIQDVESVSSRAGLPSGQALARRLRRTVYEYLLALDAARPLEVPRPLVEQPSGDPDGPMVGAEEVAALGHAARSAEESPPADAASDAAIESAGGGVPTFDHLGGDDLDEEPEPQGGDVAPADDGGAEPPASRRRFALRRRQRDEATADDAVDAVAGSDEVAGEVAAPGATAETPADAPSWQFAAATPPAVFDVGPAPDDAEVAGPPQETHPASFVAPRAGFHIVEDAPAHRSDPEGPRLEMPAFSADTPVADPALAAAPGTASPDAASGTRDAGSDFLAWRAPPPAAAEPAPPDPAPPVDAATDATSTAAPAPAQPSAAPADPEEDDEPRGWGVRRHGEARAPRRGTPALPAPSVEDDPFENNTRLSDMRRRIEERLRRKRCDEAAALLQEVAQETGGRAVAELAMNAGDRCRALGKSNAALNCYLAAARSDPVYELPLSRLADICIDNRDTELAVSYLERIARIYRFRGEDRSALRTYRRIATIAPYREDVLTLLMNAQRTGQLG